MNKKHTPEPWDFDAEGGFVLSAGLNAVCQTWSKYEEDFDNSKANGRRIVACVNACRGLELDQLEAMAELERGGIAGVGMLAVDHMLVRKQRNELADALRDLLKAYDSIMPGVKFIAVQDYAILNTAPIAARKALEKVTP